MTITERQAAEVVKSRLGQRFEVVKLNGYWVIGHKDLSDDRSFGRISPNPLRKSLELAIKDAKAVLPMGKYVCADHANGKPAHAINPKTGICYVCAVKNGEPTR